MEDSVVSPNLCTQPNALLSQLHIDEIDDGICDPESLPVETMITRADYRTQPPRTVDDLLIAHMAIFLFMRMAMTFLSDLLRAGTDCQDHTSRLCEAIGKTLPSLFGYGNIQGIVFVSLSVSWLCRGPYMKVCIPFLYLACCMGVMIWNSRHHFDIYDGKTHGLWRTGVLPTSPSACEQRLEDVQHTLLDTNYYNAQFARTVIQNLANSSNSSQGFSFPVFNESHFLNIHNDANICYQGFEGNQDLYGLGVRLCIYLQWIAALITNNLLLDSRQTLQDTWLIFSIAICILAFVASFASNCTFSIEMEILYWMYWGGFACVYVSAPCQTKLGRQAKWVSLNWDNTIRYTMHTLMAYHGIWFSWWGYDQVFARLPCGTYHFIFAKFLDPSIPYSHARDVLSIILSSIVLPLLLAIPVGIIVLGAEVKASIQESAVYRMLFRSATDHTMEHRATSVPTVASGRFLDIARETYYFVRMSAGLPKHRLGGIRLIKPVDARHRWSYRRRCLIMWLVSFSISVTAIETTLAWNRVTSVHSLDSLGQMLPLIIGMATVMSFLWKLFKDELKRRQDIGQSESTANGIELETLSPLPPTISDAIHSAYRQSDEAFLAGAVGSPCSTTDLDIYEEVHGDDPYMMSGGNGTERQSMDITSATGSLTGPDCETVG